MPGELRQPDRHLLRRVWLPPIEPPDQRRQGIVRQEVNTEVEWHARLPFVVASRLELLPHDPLDVPLQLLGKEWRSLFPQHDPIKLSVVGRMLEETDQVRGWAIGLEEMIEHEEWLKALEAEGRYLADVWASN